MAISLGRYIVTVPATSRELRDILQAAIDDGSRMVPLTLRSTETNDTIPVEFTLDQARYRTMHAEYLGKLDDRGIATLIAMTHPDLGDHPARVTLVRHTDTP